MPALVVLHELGGSNVSLKVAMLGGKLVGACEPYFASQPAVEAKNPRNLTPLSTLRARGMILSMVQSWALIIV